MRGMGRNEAVAARLSGRAGRWGAPASAAAGILWLLVWLHQRATHGATAENEERLVLGLTWMDSAKFLVVPLILVGIGLAALHARRARPGLLGRAGFVVTMAGLALMAVGAAVQFWTFPWGSYAVGFDEPRPKGGGIVQALGSLAFTVGLVVFNADLVRGRVMPIWAAPVLVMGALTTFFLTPAIWVPAAAWLLLARVLWSRPGPAHRTGQASEPSRTASP